MKYRLRLLGGLVLEGPSGPLSGRAVQQRRLALLALLAAARDKGVSRDKLVGYLWSERDEERARRRLTDTLHGTKKDLGEEVILASGEMLRLNPELVWTDVRELEDALERGEPGAAFEVYRGPFLDGFYVSEAPELERWVASERERYAGLYARALEALALEAEDEGDYRQAAEWWKRLAAQDPYDSRLVVRVMEALAAAGDVANALQHARTHELLLREELGVEPSAEVLEAAARLSRQAKRSRDAVAAAAGAPPIATEAAAIVAAPLWLRLLQEVHRRSLWQVFLIYVVVAAIGYEVIQLLTDGLGLPAWFPALAIVLFVAFFPAVLATAFVQGGLVSGAAQEPGRSGAAGVGRVLTWGNAIFAIVGAFALLGIAVTGYMGMRATGVGPFGTLVSKGVLEKRERIVLAEFEESTGDSLLAAVVTEAFRVGLSQSPVIRVAEPEYLRRVFARMEREPVARLDYELARELAVREGLTAVIAGELHPVAAGYVVSARLVLAETGEVLWTDMETAAADVEVIPAVGRLSRSLRERIGERLSSIRRSRELEQVTTSSLAALRKYTQAERLWAEAYRVGRSRTDTQMRALLDEAIALDSTFAMAYVRIYIMEQFTPGGVSALERAYQHRERLTDRERYYVEALWGNLIGDYGEALAAYRNLVEIDPAYWRAHYNAAIMHNARCEWPDAEREGALAHAGQLAAGDTMVANWSWLRALVAQGKFDEAHANLDSLTALTSRNPNWLAFLLMSSQGEYEAAEEHARADLQSAPWRASRDLGSLATLRGRLREAESYFRQAMAYSEGRDEAFGYYILGALLLPQLEAIRGAPERGVSWIDRALERYPVDSVPRAGRIYPLLAWLYAGLGATERARELLAAYDSTVGPLLLRNPLVHQQRQLMLGLVSLEEGRPEEAIAVLRAGSAVAPCAASALYLHVYLARAYDLVGQVDSAVAYYERFVTTPELNRQQWGMLFEMTLLPASLRRLGELYEARGDTAAAVHYYGKFVDLWNDADPELQPRVESARRAMEALAAGH